MNNQELEPFLEKNKVKLTAGNASTILRKVYEKVKGIDPKLFFDFLGQVLIEKPKLHEGTNRVHFFGKYNRFIVRMILPNDLYELERYFVEKYCLIEGEKLLSFFYGLVEYEQKQDYFHDRVFISNYRIFIPDVLVKDYKRYRVLFKIIAERQKLLSIPTTERRAPFGYDFPIKDPIEITLCMLTKRHRFKFPLLKDNLPSRGKIRDGSLAYSVRFLSQTHVGPCVLTIYVNHEMHKEGQKILYKIRDLLQSLQ